MIHTPSSTNDRQKVVARRQIGATPNAAADPLHVTGMLTVLAGRDAVSTAHAGPHMCHVYDTEDDAVAVAARFVADGVVSGDLCLVVAAPARRDAVWALVTASSAVAGGLRHGQLQSGEVQMLLQRLENATLWELTARRDELIAWALGSGLSGVRLAIDHRWRAGAAGVLGTRLLHLAEAGRGSVKEPVAFRVLSQIPRSRDVVDTPMPTSVPC